MSTASISCGSQLSTPPLSSPFLPFFALHLSRPPLFDFDERVIQNVFSPHFFFFFARTDCILTFSYLSLSRSKKIGVVVTKEEVNAAVDAYTETVKDKLIKDRYKFFGLFFAGAKNLPSLKWANGGDIKEAVDAKMLAVLGPKDERDVVVKKVPFVFLSDDFQHSRIRCKLKESQDYDVHWKQRNNCNNDKESW
jgi:hypothetical protein